jgi:hypothetical protein
LAKRPRYHAGFRASDTRDLVNLRTIAAS